MMREFISASAVYGFLFMIHTHTHSTIFLGEPGLAFFNTWTKEYKFSGQVACIYIYIYTAVHRLPIKSSMSQVMILNLDTIIFSHFLIFAWQFWVYVCLLIRLCYLMSIEKPQLFVNALSLKSDSLCLSSFFYLLCLYGSIYICM